MKGDETVTDHELEQDLRRQVVTYSPMRLRAALTRAPTPADAEDAVQDVFLRLLDKRPRFRDGEHEKAWLLRATLNRASDIRRGRRDDAPLEEAAQTAAEAIDYGPLLSAVRSLPEAYSTVIHLYYYEGYSIKEIARLLALPAPTVGTRLSRGRERLRNLLKEEEV